MFPGHRRSVRANHKLDCQLCIDIIRANECEWRAIPKNGTSILMKLSSTAMEYGVSVSCPPNPGIEVRRFEEQKRSLLRGPAEEVVLPVRGLGSDACSRRRGDQRRNCAHDTAGTRRRTAAWR